MQTTPLLDVNSTRVVTFSHIQVPHGCSTRVGGVSPPPWDSFNAGFTVGDQAEAVWENRRRFAQHLGVDNLPWLLSMDHGKTVVRVDEAAPVAPDKTVRPSTFYQGDACVTNVPGVPLSLTVADCVPVLFHDPVARAVGVAHAGWRGTVAGIVKETVEAMVRHYGSRPQDVRVGIGPSIGPDSFEVGSEVVAEFAAAFPESGVVLEHPQEHARSQGKGFVNLWEANRRMALRGGCQESNIVCSGWCTVSHPELFFSHRRDRGKTGRLLAAIVLR